MNKCTLWYNHVRKYVLSKVGIMVCGNNNNYKGKKKKKKATQGGLFSGKLPQPRGSELHEYHRKQKLIKDPVKNYSCESSDLTKSFQAGEPSHNFFSFFFLSQPLLALREIWKITEK